VRSAPLVALPTAVRTELTITASRISHLNGERILKRPHATFATFLDIGCQEAEKSNRMEV
jgi:hypothetical protein